MQGALRLTAELMAVAAKTAPKGKGQDCVAIRVLEGAEIQALAEGMAAYGRRTGKTQGYDRDGANVAASGAVVLIGLRQAPAAGLDCGACGFETCAKMSAAPPAKRDFQGPQCAVRVLDMGIALGSAAKTASLLNVDNRIMYRIGAAARDMGLVDWDFVMGIPLSVSSKSIYFDR